MHTLLFPHMLCRLSRSICRPTPALFARSISSGPYLLQQASASGTAGKKQKVKKANKKGASSKKKRMAYSPKEMNIVIEGCCHGALDKIYAAVQGIEEKRGVKVDLLIICGDFQALRNESDYHSFAVPPKYRKLESFWKYYKGEKEAPIPTIVIGGNHEASNYMQELFHGGWLAPNIYYLGAAGVVNFGGIRIGGISGIYNENSYERGHFERFPFNGSTMRSVYHYRKLQTFQLSQIKQPLDMFLSHDWPQGIYNHGDTRKLLQKKPFFRKEVEEQSLGSPPLWELMTNLQPPLWFSAHLHTKFPAAVKHPSGNTTKFLALDKCLPRRDFMQLITLPRKQPGKPLLEYDAEWLAVMRHTHPFLEYNPGQMEIPPEMAGGVTDEQIDGARQAILEANGSLEIPKNFQPTGQCHPCRDGRRSAPHGNQQTHELLTALQLPHMITVPPQQRAVTTGVPAAVDDNEISISSDDEQIVLQPAAEQQVQAVDDPNEVDIDDV